MVVLQQLAKDHHDKDALPNDAQELANEAMVGIIFCNGFAGRYYEWSHLTLQHFEEQVNAGYDFVTHHGDKRGGQTMTKWLAPGTLDAMRCYASLPRRPDVRTFFHPAGDDGAEVPLDVAFQKFATDFFPATGPRPTIRMLRRFYHGSRLPRVPAADRSVHVIAHTPAEDAADMRLLVESTFGLPVTWPRQEPQ